MTRTSTKRMIQVITTSSTSSSQDNKHGVQTHYLFVRDHNAVVALAAVKAIVVLSHKDTWTTSFLWAGFAKTFYFIAVNFVVFKNGKFHGLVLVLDFLWFGVGLLFAFLPAATKTEDQVQGCFLLDVCYRNG